jgi:hypothetical protein
VTKQTLEKFPRDVNKLRHDLLEEHLRPVVQDLDPLLQFEYERVQLHRVVLRKIEVFGEVVFHLFENGVLVGSFGPPSQALGRRRVERHVDRRYVLCEPLDYDRTYFSQLTVLPTPIPNVDINFLTKLRMCGVILASLTLSRFSKAMA